MTHLPHNNKIEGLKRMIWIFENGKYNFSKILINHNTEETINQTLEMGAWFGLSVYPVTKLTPNQVIDIVNRYGTDRLMVNSAADWRVSNPLSVPLTSKEMRMKGCKQENIEKVTITNAHHFYKQSQKFSWKPKFC
jgi:uncharacterized protein